MKCFFIMIRRIIYAYRKNLEVLKGFFSPQTIRIPGVGDLHFGGELQTLPFKNDQSPLLIALDHF